MRKIVAVLGVMALAACAEPAADEPTDTAAEDVAVVEAASVVGTYEGTDENGEAWMATINADGTSDVMVNGEVVDSATWRTAEDGTTCFTSVAAEGEAPAEEMCYAFGEVGEDGSVVVTGPDGEAETVTKVS